jgi:acyl transferase domain-containing protein/acyl carrier protein
MSDESMHMGDDKLRRYLRKVTADLRDAHRHINEMEEREREPIAIIGMGCRYPGGVSSPEQLWELVDSGTDAIGEFPNDRGWDVERLYDPDPDHTGTTYSRHGGFLHDSGEFDADFFSIGPREALAMDPQQRILLECAWETFEDAGIDPASLVGSQTGVFAGVMHNDYGVGAGAALAELEGYRATGIEDSVISGRLAYTFGLEGPAVSLDTACSSSLVTIHLASQALRLGECELALAGGVTVFATPTAFIEFSRQRGLAADGRCKSFGSAANGIGWAEGVGLVMLERLSQARRNGHRVLALVRGSAVNQDGASNGLTAPNGPSQERVIRQALVSAGLAPAEIDAVEAHGTGTPLGDPIEAQALLATYGQDRPAGRPLWLGALKSNIGHSAAAAGVAGVIKTVQAMRHSKLPRTLHADERSPHVDWSEGDVALLTEAVPWAANGRPRRAGVSSFGVSGTNAHVILEEAPRIEDAGAGAGEVGADGDAVGNAATPTTATAPVARSGVAPFLVSGFGGDALGAQAGRLHSFLEGEPGLDLYGAGCELALRRASLSHRAVVVAEDREELLTGLNAVELSGTLDGVVSGAAAGEGRLAFLFSGQGSQWAGMGRELYEAFPAFAGELDLLCGELDPLLGCSLKELLFVENASEEALRLDLTEFTQPALFALEVALYRLVASFGLRPDFLAGHSIGELSAAYVAGVFSLEDACRLVVGRGRLMGALDGVGAMAAVRASEQMVLESLDGFEDRLALAAVNAPEAVVVSGDETALGEWEAAFGEAEGGIERKITRLRVSNAFHSALMEPMLEEFRALAESVSFSEPAIPIVSNVTGALADSEFSSAEYWVSQVRGTVRFADDVQCLRDAGVTRFLELGPDGVLSGMTLECLGEDGGEPDDVLVAASLRKRRPQARAFLSFLAQAHVDGVDVDWSAFFDAKGAERVALPTYAFQRNRYWLSSGAGVTDASTLGQASADHPLLGAALHLAGEEDGWLFTGRLSLETHSWLRDHAVMGTVLMPGTGFVELALAAGQRVGSEVVEELTLQAPLLFADDGAVQLQVTVSEPDSEGRRELEIYSRTQDAPEETSGAEWTCHASGALCSAEGMPDAESPALGAQWPPSGAQELDIELFYERLAEAGYNYGPSFQGMRRVYEMGDDLFAEIALEEERASEAQAFCAHPALSDAALHPALLRAEQGGEVGVPFSFSGVRLLGRGAGALRLRLTADPENAGTLSLSAVDERGEPVISIQSLQTRAVDQSQLKAAQDASNDSLYELDWVELSLASADDSPARLAVLGSGDGIRSPGIELESYPDLAALESTIEQGSPAPETVLVQAGSMVEGAGGDGAELTRTIHQTAERTLELLQSWIASTSLPEAKLLLITDGAMAAAQGEAPNLDQAALVGMMNSAQSEHPGRFGVIDLDASEASRESLYGALTIDEPRLAIRDGLLYAPRFVRLKTKEHEPPELFDADGTVLITGGTGGLGALVARHLAADQGARRLLLVSRSGLQANGARELRDSLSELGCEARVAACDVSDRAQLQELLDSIPQEHPLTMVVHAAGVLDDSLIELMDGERLKRVMAPKIDAAIHLHELTAQAGLREFVLFSSAVAPMGSPGQSNYAAANGFLDALAARRHAMGLPAVSLGWGAWEQSTGMTGTLSESDRARLERFGIASLSDEHGLEMLDIARGLGEPLLMPVPLDVVALRTLAKTGMLPAVLRGLVRVPTRQASDTGGSLARRLAAAPESEWDGIVAELVRGHVAGVLGHSSPEAIDPQRAFKDLGFDSLAAVELRNRLNQDTGLKLPSTLVFDHPTSVAVAEYVRSKVEGAKHEVKVTRRSSTQSDEPIAIVGMSCRYPGGVSSPQELWELVASGRDAISEFPQDRGWGAERLYDTDPDNPGTTYTRHGGFLYDAGDFDAEFFGISPREALAMDPQQRLLLEGAWEVFEDAGITPASLAGSETGVFAGVMYQDYGLNVGAVSAEVEGYIGTGNAGSVVSGRLAYTFGLEGPAVTFNTACSSSLVALHSACQALRSGECSLALAGGVTVLVTPGVFIAFARQRGLAIDGRCKSFGAGADGTGWSEGMGLLLLERLSDAERNGHDVLAVVRGAAVNQDGASNGLTAPNGPSQQRVIGQALAGVGLSPAEVDAVEAHGTGTSLGDPIEAQALLATYGQDRPEGHPLWLGSIKSNMGHTQAAAGVAGVIKMVMAMRHGVLPKTLHAEEPSPLIDWSEGDVALLTEPVPWERNGKPRRAGVSSFGISGTNAHVILEEAPGGAREETANAGEDKDPGDESATTTPAARSKVPFLVSASSGEALAGQAARLRSFVTDDPEVDLHGVGSALALRRASLSHRAVVLAESRGDLVASLNALEHGEIVDDVVRGVAGGGRKVAFLFSGQGSQWAGMGRELLESSPVFAEQVKACADAFSAYFDWSLEDVLRGVEGTPSLERVDVIQPALFTMLVSLAALWRSFGVEPALVLGHSQGEIAAAYVAGGLSLDDAVKVVALRAKALGDELSGRGGMLSVALPAEQVATELGKWGERLSVGVINGPRSVAVSGENEALDELLAHYEARGVRTRRIALDYASHSGQMEAIQARLADELTSIAPRTGEIPFYSSTTGTLLDTAGLDGAYWYTNLREPVHFYDATRVLLEGSVTTFIETSPHPILTVAVDEAVEAQGLDPQTVAAIGSLRREQGGLGRFLASLSQAHVSGVDVDWKTFFAGKDVGGRVALPTYAFQRRRYWLASAAGVADASALGQSLAEHPLLGAALHLAGADDAWLFTGRLSAESHPWLRDHAVMDSMLMPGTGFLELALAAGQHVGAEVIEELTLQAPLLLSENGAAQLQITVSEPDPEGRRELEIYSRPHDSSEDVSRSNEWTRHAAGVLCPEAGAPGPDLAGLANGDEWPPAGSQELDSEYFYDRLAEAGYNYGPSFRGLRKVFGEGEDLFAEVELEEDRRSEAQTFCIHPALSDSALHAALLSADRLAEVEVPFAFTGVRLFGRGAGALRVRLAGDGEGAISSLFAVDELGDPVLSIQGLQTRAIDQSQLKVAASSAGNDALHGVEWVELLAPSVNGSQPRVVVLGAGAALQRSKINPESHADLAALKDAIEQGAAPPELVLVEAAQVVAERTGVGDGSQETEDDARVLAETVHRSTRQMLELLQEWVSSEALSDAKLVLVTDRALAVVEGDTPNLAQAALVGLMRSAQSEHPGRFGVIDLDESETSADALQGALSLHETELAIRQGSVRAPRLARLSLENRDERAFDCAGTVLITGGTGGLGALMAHHLAAEHGAKRLLLVSRSGSEATGVKALCDSLSELGCEARIAACDVADRGQLQELLATIPPEYPLTAVIHAAGVIDDGLIESLDAESFSRVLTPKVDAAINLHELTEHAGLSEFVLFSSIAASMGSPGQGNYAAANAFLDALAAHRRAKGLPCVSLAWSAWDRATGMTGALTESDRARFERVGIVPLSDEQGLELFDIACRAEEALILPVRLDMGSLRAQAKAGMLPMVLRGLVRVPTRQASDTGGSLERRLADSPEAEWDGIVLELVRGHVAGVLGYASPEEVDPRRAFKELGFDSLAAVELRNRLGQAMGLKLPSTLVFDHPTPAAVAEYTRSKVSVNGAGAPAIDEQLDKLEAALASIAEDDGERTRIKGRLQGLTRRVQSLLADDSYVLAAVGAEAEDALESATDDEVFELLDKRRDDLGYTDDESEPR